MPGRFCRSLVVHQYHVLDRLGIPWRQKVFHSVLLKDVIGKKIAPFVRNSAINNYVSVFHFNLHPKIMG